MNPDFNSLDQARSTLVDLAIRFGPRLLVAILIVGVGLFVAGWAAKGAARGIARLDLEPPVRSLLLRLLRASVLAVFVLMALQNLGVELLPLLAGLGLAGAGVALATQGVLSNIVAGLSIIFSKPYRVGDYIGIAGVEGRVESVTLSNTTLSHADRSNVVVPNRKIVGEILHNYGQIRQAEVRVGVAFDTDLPVALAVVSAAVRANARVLTDPAPLIQVAALGESAIDIAVRPWVAVTDFGTIPGELNLAIVDALRRAGIAIPFPQREVRLLGDGRTLP